MIYSTVRTLTTSDTVDLDMGPPSALYATVAGNVALMFEDGSTVTMPIAAATLLPVRCKRVLATGTTATGLFGLK